MKFVRNMLVGLLLFCIATHAFGQYAGGTFQTDFGKMTLQQNGNQLSGTYDYWEIQQPAGGIKAMGKEDFHSSSIARLLPLLEMGV